MTTKIESPEQLQALRDKARAAIELRTGQKATRIVVHMGTCGIAAGARDILSRVMEQLERASIDDVSVHLAGCLGLCDQEPMLTLTDRSGNEFCYGHLTRSKVDQIIHQHVMDNEPLVEYLVSTRTGKEG
jgi:NADP-reducing hydrogenase subunit HndB